jgi:hypothetical protein
LHFLFQCFQVLSLENSFLFLFWYKLCLIVLLNRRNEFNICNCYQNYCERNAVQQSFFLLFPKNNFRLVNINFKKKTYFCNPVTEIIVWKCSIFHFLACFLGNLSIARHTKLWKNLPLTFLGNSNKKIQLSRLKNPPKTLFSQGPNNSFNLLSQVFFQILRVWVVQTHIKWCLW